MRTRTKGQENKRMKRFRETGSMLVKKAKKKVAKKEVKKVAKKEVKKVAPKQDAPKAAPQPKAKAPQLAPKQEDNRSPSGRLIIDEQVVEKLAGGRGQGKRLFNFTPVESSGGGARTGKGKKKRDTKLFDGTYTSRGRGNRGR